MRLLMKLNIYLSEILKVMKQKSRIMFYFSVENWKKLCLTLTLKNIESLIDRSHKQITAQTNILFVSTQNNL